MIGRNELKPEQPPLEDDIRVVREIPQEHFPDPLCRCVGCSANRLADALERSDR
jgi:hypothetical protein